MRHLKENAAARDSYIAELTSQWRVVVGATLGMGFGFAFAPYIYSIMGPHLIAEFGWARSDFAATTILILITVVVFPIIGRLNDILGVRKTALIGVIGLPATFVAFAAQTGSLPLYMILLVLQASFGITTTAIIYTRIIVQTFTRARGLALGIAAAGPALCGVFAAPFFNNFVESHGWRQGYLLVALVTLAAGVIALLTLPARNRTAAAPLASANSTGADYRAIFGAKAFWILAAALFFANVPLAVALTQLTLLLLENGVPTAHASYMLSTFAVGTLIGRLLCGAAIDRWPSHLVAAISMSIPAFGLAVFASDFDAPWLLMCAVFTFGFASGAESDAIGYIVSKQFSTRIYSSVFSFMSAAMALSTAAGAIILSLTLAATNNFNLFLCIGAASVLVGGALFLLLKPPRGNGEEAVQAAH